MKILTKKQVKINQFYYSKSCCNEVMIFMMFNHNLRLHYFALNLKQIWNKKNLPDTKTYDKNFQFLSSTKFMKKSGRECDKKKLI